MRVSKFAGQKEVCVFCGGTIEYDPQRVIEPDGTEYVEANPYCPECLDNG